MEKKVLILTDSVGFGDVALNPIRSILIKMGYSVFSLPTAIVSNTWNRGKCAMLDTTQYMQQSIDVWEEMGISFDAVLIGYLADEKQAKWIAKCCDKWHRDGAVIVLDPLFADNSKLYRGITEQQISLLRSMMANVDIVLPNLTEAQFLAGTGLVRASISGPDLIEILERIKKLGQVQIIITSACVDGKEAVVVCNGQKKEIIPYFPVPGNFSGAGDCFSAFFLGEYLEEKKLVDSIKLAMARTKEVIQKSLNEERDVTGIPVERYM